MQATAKKRSKNAILKRQAAQAVAARLGLGQSTKEIAAALDLTPQSINAIVRQPETKLAADELYAPYLPRIQALVGKAIERVSAALDAKKKGKPDHDVRLRAAARVRDIAELATGGARLAVDHDVTIVARLEAARERLRAIDVTPEPTIKATCESVLSNDRQT